MAIEQRLFQKAELSCPVAMVTTKNNSSTCGSGNSTELCVDYSKMWRIWVFVVSLSLSNVMNYTHEDSSALSLRHELNKQTNKENRHAKVKDGKATRPQAYPRNYRQLRNAARWEKQTNGIPKSNSRHEKPFLSCLSGLPKRFPKHTACCLCPWLSFSSSNFLPSLADLKEPSKCSVL